ncbi:enoyl-CoA hydratase-related protein [Ornithinicoccus halotolerans]|uniref:enoyl-CoA hydratase-related protein n=1 Tax=Ornithinicoccus halotolerans TaxID=1748220 RepID=UPI0018864CE3|nr:enoyl-CoA hydratase-related protein [Ornithinicoccus halotolerans]
MRTDREHWRVEGHVATLRIGDPRRRNTLTTASMRHYAGLLAQVPAGVRVVLLRGAAEGGFAAGADIGELADPATRGDVDRVLLELCTAIRGVPVPVVAVVDGHCLGAGVAVALAADLRLATTGSTFAVPAARLGAAYPVELVEELVAAVGPGAATRMLCTAATLTGEEAGRVGLADEVVPAERLAGRVAALVDQVTCSAPLSLRAAVTAVRAARPMAAPDALAVARAAEEACWTSDDVREGTEAFLQRRPATFSGR